MIETEVRPELLNEELSHRFRRLVTLDLAMSEYLSFLNQKEIKLDEELVEGLIFANFLIKRSLFSTFTEILDYGSTETIHDASETLEEINQFRNGERDELMVEGSVNEDVERVKSFIGRMGAIDYENRYLEKR